MRGSDSSARKDASNLWKLLSSGDKVLVTQGMEIAESMGAPMDALLEGVSVNERTGELIRNNRFSGTRDAQPLLDRVLLHQLSLADADTPVGKLRAQVRKVVILSDEIPVLRGFDGLEALEITLPAPQNINQAPALDDLSALGPLPSLKTLRIEAQTLGRAHATLKSLAGLHAPALEQADLGNLGLQDIEPLGICSQLRRVNLSASPALDTIDALSGSAATLETLDLSKCASLTSLSPLKGARVLRSLRLDGCRGIDSLLPLSDSRELTDVSFDDLAALTSLAGLSAPFITTQDRRFGEKHLSISGCSALTSLQGLPPLDPEITSVMLIGFDALKDLKGLTASPTVTRLCLRGEALEHLDGLQGFTAVDELEIHGAAALVDAGPLGAMTALTRLTLTGCGKLTRLPSRWQAPLSSLALGDCDALQSLGHLPASLRWLRIAGCRALTAIDGLQDVQELKLSIVSRLTDPQAKAAYLSDASALARIPTLKVNFEPENELYNHPDARATVFPDGLAQALAQVPALALSVGDEKSSGFSTSIKDVGALARIASLRSLDLTACKYVSDLKWAVALPGLTHLQLWPGSDVAKLAGGSTHPSPDHVRKLQARLCRKYGIEAPPHLAPAAKTAAKSTATPTPRKTGKDVAALKKLIKGEGQTILQAIEVIRSLDDADMIEAVLPDLSKAFGRLLSSADPAQVSIGIEALTSFAPPSVFDGLAEGVNEAMAYSGDSEAIGKIFKNVKQPDRTLARWALTWLLALAPAEATVAAGIRSSLKAIDLVAVPGLSNGQPPSLSGFTGLEDVRLRGISATDLRCLDGLSQIKTVKLSACHALTSLQGLESATGITGLSLSDCPTLADLSVLAAMPELQSSPGDTYGSHAVRLDPGRGLSDIGFVIGLKAVHRIELRLAASADTRPFLQCPWITDARLTLESWDIDLSGFRHCESLQVRCDDAQGTHAWAYDFPTLKSLEVMGGQHRFDAMQAPLLEDLRLSRVSVASMRGLSGCRDLNLSGSTLGCLEGLGPVRALRLWDTTIGDFRGIESAELTMLDLSRGTYAGLAPITRIRSLQTLKFNEASSSASALQLPPCPQIRSLEIPGFSGSLSFLAGWTALEELDLRNSGKLTDIDALTGLTTLKKIRIRGATVKRDAWPAQLKDSLDTR